MEESNIYKSLLTLFGKEFVTNAYLIAIYGSQISGHDLDILIVQRNPVATPSLIAGMLDLSLISEKDFHRRLKLLDPFVTEPLFTGKMLSGNHTEFSDLKKQIQNITPTQECLEYLVQESMNLTIKTCNLWNNIKETNEFEYLKWVLQNLSFSISYKSFACFYNQENSRPCTLNDLILLKKILLPSFWEYRGKARKNSHNITCSNIEMWISKWLNFNILSTGQMGPSL